MDYIWQIEQPMMRAQIDVDRDTTAQRTNVTLIKLHAKLTDPFPQTKRSLDLKLARQVNKSSKRDLQGLNETLVPVVTRTFTTSISKEPFVPEVRVRNSDNAKIGPKTKIDTSLYKNSQNGLFLMRQ